MTPLKQHTIQQLFIGTFIEYHLNLNLPTKLTIWTNSSNVILILQNDIYLPYESSNKEIDNTTTRPLKQRAFQ